jgi:hypothetical protein
MIKCTNKGCNKEICCIECEKTLECCCEFLQDESIKEPITECKYAKLDDKQ